jgi:NADPH:quinone reductase
VPAHADLGAVSTVPVAGVSALSALHRVGPPLGRRVLVTGATGGVGRYAVQLARLGGAEVVAVTSRPDAHGDELVALGAARVVTPDEVPALGATVDGVVENVGGPLLVAAFHTLARNGTLVSLGHLSAEPESFAPGELLSGFGQDNRSIVTFFMPESTDLARGMAWLAGQVADGAVDPGIAWRGPWSDADQAVTALLERRLAGKAVLDL